MADTTDDLELVELRQLMEKKEMYGWADDNPDFIKRRTPDWVLGLRPTS